MTSRHISFGGMAKPLHIQLGCDEGLLATEQKLANAVLLCTVQGVLTDAESTRARQRIIKRIQKRFKEAAKTT